MKTKSLLMLIMLGIIGMLSAQATGLFISEYVEGSGFNKAIEIFNGTGAPVDLAEYSLKKQTNGAGAFGGELLLTGTLANNDVFVVINNSTAGANALIGQPFVDLATSSQSVNFNGNDAVALYHNGVQIDVVGVVDQVTPDWGKDMTLVRNANIASPTTAFALADWTAYPIDTFTNLGTHTFTGGTTDPIIIVSNPNTEVTWYVGQTYTISWSSSNVTGNVQIELNNNEAYSTLADNIENTGSWVWNIPLNQPLGTQCKIKISNIGVTVSDMSDAFFTIAAPTACPTIAQLRASTADGTTVYSLSNEAVLTFKQAFRFQKFVQDATAAILIDDMNGVITTAYNVGDGITGLTGTISEYAGMLQLIPISNPGVATSTGNVITPQIITLSELTTNFETYESELVKINDCSFTSPTGNFANGVIYPISDAAGTYNFRTGFYDVDYIGQPIPTIPMHIVGIPTSRLETNVVTCFFTARNTADFLIPTSQASAPTFDPAAGLYSSPLNVTISSATTDAAIYYTLDGTEPTALSTVYASPILVSETTTIKAIAIADGMPASDISVATYTIVVANEDLVNDNSPLILMGNYPNPFNNNTTISFKSRSAQPVQIEIYNMKGQLIRTLTSDMKVSGESNVTWNALDENGRRVAAGMYLFNIKGGKYTNSKKMVLLK